MVPALPSLSCLSPREEDWEPSLDPMAITRGATGPPRLLALGITLVLASLSLAALVLVPWRPMRLASGLGRFASARTVAVDLGFHEVAPRGAQDRVRLDLPGGDRGDGQWAPTRTPGAGGMGDLETIPSLPTLDARGELSSTVPLAGRTVAMGGGWAPTGGFAGGSPQGRGGTGGGGGRAVAGLRELGEVGASEGSALVPVFAPTPRVTVDQRLYRAAMVVVGIHIQMNGKVSEAVVRSGPEHLHGHAHSAALRWRFKPLRECGFAAPLWIDVHFDFLLKGPTQ